MVKFWTRRKSYFISQKNESNVQLGCLSMKLSLPQPDVYRRLKNSSILDDYIVKGYDILHTFSREYLMSDLISYMKEKGVLS